MFSIQHIYPHEDGTNLSPNPDPVFYRWRNENGEHLRSVAWIWQY